MINYVICSKNYYDSNFSGTDSPRLSLDGQKVIFETDLEITPGINLTIMTHDQAFQEVQKADWVEAKIIS